ncbi:vitamin K-dependent gamma-carboxylase [Planococcus citri]|uniref:vitamin K-dependent gamma-carboxylase n=1 Tax=Planococcus citri TaxID=170843 RepID=UPI0031F7DB7D
MDNTEETNDTSKEINNPIENKCGCLNLCKIKERVKSWIELLFEPTDPSSIAFFRISFGILMMLDIPHERQLAAVDKRWGDPKLCHFPLIHSLRPLPYNWMCIVYLIMWLGTIGIALGYHFRKSCLAFVIPYWYIVLLDKSHWNNHTYLFGLISILLFFTDANATWSIDQYQGRAPKNPPFWNYFLLRYQVFILYFMAAVKKVDFDWLAGHSMEHLSHHWIFTPFKIFLTNRQIDFWIIHITGFLIDAFAGFGLQFKKTRPATLFFLFLFHTMNSRMFNIGMFPYVGLATMFIFCDLDWPRKLLHKVTRKSKPTSSDMEKMKVSKAKKCVVVVGITFYVFWQLFMPFSHSITKGYNAWTTGQYGYSWDMMVHAWKTSMVMVKVVDHNNGNIHYLDAEEWTPNDKWTKHPDTLIQYAQCAEKNLKEMNIHNISIYVDVWTSLNGRFYQRMFDPRVDLLRAEWSPFTDTPWVLPLMTELSGWRYKMKQIQDEVYATSNYSDVIFVADFPGMYLENYVDESLINVTLSVLQGRVRIRFPNNRSSELETSQTDHIPRRTFHEVHTVSQIPSCYMYLFFNKTLMDMGEYPEPDHPSTSNMFNDIRKRIVGINRSIYLIGEAILAILRENVVFA